MRRWKWVGLLILSVFLNSCGSVQSFHHQLNEPEYKKSHRVAVISITCEKAILSELHNDYVDEMGLVVVRDCVIPSAVVLESVREHVFWIFDRMRPFWIMPEHYIFSSLGYNAAKNELELKRSENQSIEPLQGYATVALCDQSAFNTVLSKLSNADSGMLIHVVFKLVKMPETSNRQIEKARVVAGITLCARNRQGKELAFYQIYGMSERSVFIIKNEKLNAVLIRNLCMEAMNKALLTMEYYIQQDHAGTRL